MYAPGLDIQLVEMLGLERSVDAHLYQFHGLLCGDQCIEISYHIARSEPDAVIMLAGVELCSLHYQKSNEPNQVVANALFGDGAAAVIVSARSLSSDEANINYALKNFYAEFEQSASEDMVWRIGDVGF